MIIASSCAGGGVSRSAGSMNVETQTDTTLLVFDKELHNFGKVSAGEEIACRFGFTNQGNSPLVIQDVVAGCGCTNVKYPNQPIQPGEKGAIEVTFDTRGRNGHQRQALRVVSNGTPYPKELIIRAEVE